MPPGAHFSFPRRRSLVYGRAPAFQRRTSVHVGHRPLEGDCLIRAKTLLLVAAGLVIAGRAGAVTISRGPIIENPDALTSTMTIAWWTDTAGDSTVEYGPTPALGFSQTVAQAGSCEIGSAGTCHIVSLSGLFSGTRYYYRLKTNGVTVRDTGASGPYFTTLKDPTDPTDLFFTVFGDWGQASSHEQSVSDLQNTADPQMIVTVGDNAYQNGTQSDWTTTRSPTT